MRDLQVILNYGKYASPVLTAAPTWDGKEGEQAQRFEVNGTGYNYYIYYWVNSGWTYAVWTGAGNTLVPANDSITTAMLQGGAVTTAKIANLAVTSAEIGSGAVTTAKIASSYQNGNVVNYTGDGIVDHYIAHGLGRTPIIVIIQKTNLDNLPPELWTTNIQTSYSRDFSGVVGTDKIRGVDGTNVQLGTSAQVNQDGISYDMFVM